MARKLILNVDLSKIDKTRIQEKVFTNKEGNQVKQLNYRMEVILLDEDRHKTIKEYETSSMVKTGFVVEGKTKEEREAKTPDVFLSDVIEFIQTGEPRRTIASLSGKSEDEKNRLADLAAQEDKGDPAPEDIPW